MSEVNKSNSEQSLAFIHTGMMADFYIDKGAEDYLQCIQALNFNLSAIEEKAFSEDSDPHKARLLLAPSQKATNAEEAKDGYRVYGELPEETTDLMLMTELLTHSKTALDTRGEGQYGKVITRGHYGDNYVPVFFTETYGFDEIGDYVTWEVSNVAPVELSPALVSADDETPFFTTGERSKMYDQAIDGISKIPTIEVDEADLVRNWFDQKAA